MPALQNLTESVVSSSLVRRWQIEGYEPEIIRYGGTRGIAYAHELFQCESDAVVDLLNYDSYVSSERVRQLAATEGILRISRSLDPSEPMAVVEQAHRNAQSMHRGGPEVDILAKTYREVRPAVEGLIRRNLSVAPQDVQMTLSVYLDQFARIATRYGAMLRRHSQADRVPAIGSSVVHMHANRHFRWNTLRNEYFAYDWLVRANRSVEARLRASKTHPTA